MEEQQIPAVSLREIRNVPETINATIDFIRLHLRGLLKLVLTRVSPLVLITQILSIYITSARENDPFDTYGISFLGQLFLIAICYLIAYALLIGITHSYVRLAASRGSEEFSTEDVWESTKDSFWRIVGTMLGLGVLGLFGGGIFIRVAGGIGDTVPLLGIVIFLAGIFFFATIWSLYLPARFVDDYGFFKAFGRSQRLIQGRFWGTLGLLLFLWLLCSVLIPWLMVPALIQEGILEYVGVYADPEQWKIVLDFLAIVFNTLSPVLYMLPMISIAIHYYSQVERKETPEIELGLYMIGQQEEVEEKEEQADAAVSASNELRETENEELQNEETKQSEQSEQAEQGNEER